MTLSYTFSTSSITTCSVPNNCWCHYFFEKKANVLNCSHTNLTSLEELHILNGTMWLVAKYNDISHLKCLESLDHIQHFDLQNSSVFQISDDFFSEIKTMKKPVFLNLANNDLKSFPKSLNGTSFSQAYLAGNPIDCNCEMLWFADWLNTTNPRTKGRIVADYEQVVCVGGTWDGTQVYKLNAGQMGCYPKILAE